MPDQGGPFWHVFYVQMCPLQRPLKWESVATFPSPASKSFAFRVVSGQTLELVIAQFWSSGIGSHDTASVDFEVTEFVFLRWICFHLLYLELDIINWKTFL